MIIIIIIVIIIIIIIHITPVTITTTSTTTMTILNRSKTATSSTTAVPQFNITEYQFQKQVNRRALRTGAIIVDIGKVDVAECLFKRQNDGMATHALI
jgi:hypothetical protein